MRATKVKREAPETRVLTKTSPAKGKGVTKTRSRFGCEECKNKRTKCDETKPSCGRCKGKGVKCTYKIVLQFKEDLERQGKSFGREGVWSKTNKKAPSVSSDSTYFKAMEHRRLQFVNFGWGDFTMTRSLQPTIIPMEIKNQIGGDFNIINHPLNFYITFISPIFNPIGTGGNLYFNHVYKGHDRNIVVEQGLDLSSLIQYCHTHTPLFNLLLSLGLIYLYKQTKSSFWLNKAVHFKDLSLNGLILKDDTPSMISCILMILYELANDGAVEWAAYLKCCKQMLTANFKFPTDSVECSMLKFALEFLHYQDTVGRTACKDRNKFFTEYDSLTPRVDNEFRLVSWMGCDRALLEVISDVTDLSFERLQLQITEENYFLLSIQLKAQIEALNMNLFDNLIKHIDLTGLSTDVILLKVEFMMDDFSKVDFHFLLSCEVKRLSADIYLECCLLNKGPGDSKIESMVKFCVVILDILVLQNSYLWISNLTWSIFVFASQISLQWLDSDLMRYTILSCLEKIEKHNFGNIGTVRDSIIKCWKRRDLHDEPVKPVARTSLLGFVNEWDYYVVDVDAVLSLG